ncbi:MAG: hypothetical protein KC492_08660 [Myxococcales bacterium]|nr:hypothetical protein [Myxococcales bacterium]MCB9605144.1 hypothetical protein [Polyangiaceae bacterium]
MSIAAALGAKRRSGRGIGLGALSCAALSLLSSSRASAAEEPAPVERDSPTVSQPAPEAGASPNAPDPAVRDTGERFELLAERGLFLHTYAGFAVGDGIRLNNPYRLPEPLGDSPESLSRSAVYGDLAVGLLIGRALGWQHGAQVDLAFALEGIPQEVLTPSYLLHRHFSSRWSAYARLGFPVVLEPDLNVGVEAGLGGLFAITGGVQASLELIYSQFYGAATQEVSITVIPIVSAQLGVRVAYEVLQ